MLSCKTIWAIVLTLVPTLLLAQSKAIRGVVYDIETNQALAYASVGLANKPNGVITNHQGQFHLYLNNPDVTDTLVVSYLGYKSQLFPLGEVEPVMQVGLHSASIELEMVEVHVKKFTPQQLIDSMKANFKKRHHDTPMVQQCFYHQESFIEFKQGRLELDKSTVDGFDKDFIQRFNEIIPKQVCQYEQHAFDIYGSLFGKCKLNPGKSVRLDDTWEVKELMEIETEKLDTTFFNDEKHYKIRSGLIPIPTGYRKDKREEKKRENDAVGGEKAGNDTADISDESTVKDERPELGDGEQYVSKLKSRIGKINLIIRNVTNKNKSPWDFLHDYNKYSYDMKLCSSADQSVYIIRFKPQKRKASYEGKVVLSATDFALIQLDYALVEGKSSKSFNMLGLGIEISEDSGVIQYEKVPGGYYLKFLHHAKTEEVVIDRPLTITEREKEDAGPKRKIKGSLEFKTKDRSLTQFLIVSRTLTSQQEIDDFKEPVKMKVEEIREYDLQKWAEQSIIEPSDNLKKYKKQFE